MSLLDEAKESCVMLDKRTVPDGLGGFRTVWQEGAVFLASIAKDNTVETRIAEQQGFTEAYTVIVDKGLELQYHDVFRRVSDGQTFRVTSNIKDSKTPDSAGLQIGSVSAEKWDVI